MIALCQAHHAEAEGGRWTRDELRALKANAPQPQQVAKDFPWRIGPEQKLLFRLGGNYATSKGQHIIVLNGRPLLSQERSDEGLALFSLAVFGADDTPQLQVVQNSVSVESLGMWDVQFHGQHSRFIVRPIQGTIALDLHLKRLSLEDFKALANQDTAGMAGTHFFDYVVKNCADSDGDIVFVDIDRAELHAGGKVVSIRDGIVTAGFQLRGCVALDSGKGAFFL